ncbi:MAG: hsp70 family protein [Candidatus Magnetoovum sp. WYHC-5]|nr:hsp70 family protein [Candidatus Magnetoovum sp. WYHC-5]
MKDSPYIIGIDLGTTNSTVAYVDTKAARSHTYPEETIQCSSFAIRIFTVPQLVSEGNLSKLSMLPSYLYIPIGYDIAQKNYQLPWSTTSEYIVGEFARVQGARVPANLVSSAKSWLCHNRVDRRAAILPWGREDSKGKLSPLEASRIYLTHMRDAWNHEKAEGRSKEWARLENQQIVLTIPASFDESARELTQEAAKGAGFKHFTMLEEPQAAFYSWLAAHENNWQDILTKDDLVLVFDVGGGTTDFNLISLKGENMAFQRVAVGDHLMLGGDNMDLALAHGVEQKLTGGKSKLGFNQWLALAQQCRVAKESLLGVDDSGDSYDVTLLGSGRGVVGGTLKGSISKEEIKQTVLDGFFKSVGAADDIEGKRAGFQELGLPYVSDPAVMKHLAHFLRRHSVNKELKQVVDKKTGVSIVKPDVLLFNGGVFKAPIIRQYARQIINEWFADDGFEIAVLDNNRLDHAVSIGAAYYGYVLRGKGIKITGGTAKTYYIKVETDKQAKPADIHEPITCLCILPKGVEEGEEINLTEQEFQVRTNSPVGFNLYYSSYRVGDKAGQIITTEKTSLMELPAVKTVLHYGKKSGSIKIPVSIGIRLNEYGTIDIWCESKTTPHRWRLAFQVREDNIKQEEHEFSHLAQKHTLDEATIESAIELISKAFTTPAVNHHVSVMPENLTKKLSDVLTIDKAHWPLTAIRRMWDELIKLKETRKTTHKHEARWLNLAGFLLRPGFGHPVDEWRIKELWKIFSEGVVFSRDGQCKAEWWILWRRVAGGITEKNQEILYKKLFQVLGLGKSKHAGVRLSHAEVAEVWMLVASLELLQPEIKITLGNELLKLIVKEKTRVQGNFLWALSRVGARVPFYGPIEKTITAAHVSIWIKELLNTGIYVSQDLAYTITQLARKTGDRTRDIDDGLREKIVEAFASDEWIQTLNKNQKAKYIKELTEVVSYEWEDEKAVFGESLPDGLSV